MGKFYFCFFYFMHVMVSDIVNRVKSRESIPCRPVLFQDMGDLKPEVIQLMESCWHDNEFQRPTFGAVRSYIKKNIQQGE